VPQIPALRTRPPHRQRTHLSIPQGRGRTGARSRLVPGHGKANPAPHRRIHL